jgi:uncharacterized membrane protein
MGHRPHRFPRHVPRRSHVRLLAAGGAGVLAALLVPARLGLVSRLLAGWDVAALVLATFAWAIILASGVQETQGHAATQDPGRRAVGVLVIVTSAVSLLATAVILRQARSCPPAMRELFVALCILAVAGAWVLTHTAYALRYAHLYYRDDDEGVGGLEFPCEHAPCYFDFAYFSFTVGMCFQVSDVTVSSPQIRRAVLGQAILAFIYNTTIMALALNLVFGLLN